MTAAMRTAEDERQSPKYAHVERERRWLVDAAARPSLDDLHSVLIEDRYIHSSRMRLRRMTHSATGATSLKLTKKYEAADPLARPMVTFYLDEAEYALMAGLAADSVTKRRFGVDVGGEQWSLDCFAGSLEGLELLEIEAPDAASLCALRPPAWALFEVSADPRYEGGTLASLGLAKEETWRQS